MILNICHLYPDLMDTYGDKGNIITLVNRCRWRGLDVSVDKISIDQNLKNDAYDLFFFGGGQDTAQSIVATDLKKKAKILTAGKSSGSVMLSICGGYQLLQKYFKTHMGEKLEGIGLFDAYTEASNDRMIQNLLIEITPQLKSKIDKIYPIDQSNLIGFENHSGKTYLGKGTQPLGTVRVGAGNNGQDKTEGAVSDNFFGCYLHGSLLPKNPHFADFLISLALERRYGKIKLEKLDDEIEWQAHEQAVKRARKVA